LWLLADHERNMIDHFDNDADTLLWNSMSWHSNIALQFLRNCFASKYNTDNQRKLLVQLEQQLHITTTNYRSIRRLSVEWNTNKIDTEAKQLVITRLLQALRYKAYRAEILPQLEKLAKLKRYELVNVCNPETGEEPNNKSIGNAISAKIIAKPQMTLLKKLAVAAAIGVGAALLTRPHKD
jgi:hypothetical protein